jgi:hypothetical protein
MESSRIVSKALAAGSWHGGLKHAIPSLFGNIRAMKESALKNADGSLNKAKINWLIDEMDTFVESAAGNVIRRHDADPSAIQFDNVDASRSTGEIATEGLASLTGGARDGVARLSLMTTMNDINKHFAFVEANDLLFRPEDGLILRIDELISNMKANGTDFKTEIANANLRSQTGLITQVRRSLSDEQIAELATLMREGSYEKVPIRTRAMGKDLGHKEINMLVPMNRRRGGPREVDPVHWEEIPEPRLSSDDQRILNESVGALMDSLVEKHYMMIPGWQEDVNTRNPDPHSFLRRIGSQFMKATLAAGNRGIAQDANNGVNPRIMTISGLVVASATASYLKAILRGQDEWYEQQWRERPMSMVLDTIAYTGVLGFWSEKIALPALSGMVEEDASAWSNKRDWDFAFGFPVQTVGKDFLSAVSVATGKLLKDEEITDSEWRAIRRFGLMGIMDTTVAHALRLAADDLIARDGDFEAMQSLIDWVYPEQEDKESIIDRIIE